MCFTNCLFWLELALDMCSGYCMHSKVHTVGKTTLPITFQPATSFYIQMRVTQFLPKWYAIITFPTWVVVHLLIVQVYIFNQNSLLHCPILVVVFVVKQLFFVNIGRTLYSLRLGELRSI